MRGQIGEQWLAEAQFQCKFRQLVSGLGPRDSFV